jgi:hypothetical protein
VYSFVETAYTYVMKSESLVGRLIKVNLNKIRVHKSLKPTNALICIVLF